MDFNYDPRIKEWYVAFCNPKKMCRGQKYLKNGFRHCYAFGFDTENKTWLVFNPGWDGMVLRTVKNPARMVAEAYKEGPVLLTKTFNDPIWKPRVFMVCTSQICHLLGLDLFVHTPWRLFRALKVRGASEILFNNNLI